MKGKIVATYDYVDAKGNLLFQVVRYEPKAFKQRRPNGKGGWIWNMQGVSVVPYCLPKILKATRVYICEGEEDVKALQILGLTATTNPGGAGKWQEAFSKYFQGKEVVIIPDNDEAGREHAQDVARKLTGVAASIKVVELPGLPPKGDPRDWVRAGGTAEVLEALVNNAPEWQLMESTASVGLYLVHKGVLCYEKFTKDGKVLIPLCNFSARIVEEVVHDDGADSQTYFSIEGLCQDGRPLHRISVPVSQFPSLSWVTKSWGNRAVVYAGPSTKDHLRTAIQLHSGEPPRRTVFRHIGWRLLENEWIYLHGGGGIGADGAITGLEVILEKSLKDYVLTLPPQGSALQQPVRASLHLVRLGPSDVTYPLLGGTYRAPLGECAPVDLSLFIVGQTGILKTAVSAVFQSHNGAAFHGRNLPGNWASTDNFLEKQSFLTKDAVFTVDDFVPRGSSVEIQKLHRTADRLLRGQANQSGRGRMGADERLRPTYFPRGLVISNGEDVPGGQSLGARMFILEVKKGDVDLQFLTKAQADAARGLFAQAMAGYLVWLAPRIEELKKSLPARQLELRTAARQEMWGHNRTPEILASLQAGFEVFLQFAADVGAITGQEEIDLATTCWQALMAAGRNQEGHRLSEDPTRRFLSLLRAALTSGRAHMADAKTNGVPVNPVLWGWRPRSFGVGENTPDEWQPQGNCVGWLDGDNLLLEPDAAFAVVQRMAKDQEHTIPWTQRTLWKRLSEKGLLASREPSQNRNTVRWTIAGDRRRVIHLKVDSLYPKTDPTGPTGPEADNHEGFCRDHFSDDRQEAAQDFGPTHHDDDISQSHGDFLEVTI